MRIILKILAAPFVLVLTLLVAVLSFLQYISGWIFYLAAIILGVAGAGLLFTGNISGGIGVLVIAFLVSPFGLPAVAGWITDLLDELNYSLKGFITS